MAKSKGKVLVSTSDKVLASMLIAAETAGEMALADREHRKVSEENKGKLWRDFGVLAANMGLESFQDHWNAIKPDLKKPENAERFGAELITEGKNKGDYRISHYLTEIVSRLTGALKRKMKILDKEGNVRPMNKLADALSERSEAEREEAARAKDSLYDERRAVSKGLVDIADTVRKGSHSADTLKTLARVLTELNAVLKSDGKKVKQAVARAVTKPAKPATQAPAASAPAAQAA